MKKSVSIEIDDKQRSLRYGYQAISAIEDKLNCSIATIDFNNLRISQLNVIIWAGLIHEDKEITPDKLLEIIDDNDVDMTYLATKIGEAFSAAFGAQTKK